MIFLRDSDEDEMVLEFLRAEAASERFGDDLRNAAERLGIETERILAGNLSSAEENRQRRAVLREYRGYPDREIFENYPAGVKWSYVRFEARDMDKMRYISYSYWDELSRGTSRPAEAAENIRSGTVIFGVPNDRFLAAAAALDKATFPPPIFLAVDGGYLLIEGHLRMTAYALRPEKFPGAVGMLGIPIVGCADTHLAAWCPRGQVAP